MAISSLKRIERALRSARDRWIAKPLAATPWIQRHADGRFDMVVRQFADHRLAFDPADKVIGRHVDTQGDWFRADFHRVLALLSEAGYITRDKVFLDVGANIGTQTVYALIGDNFARAVCFEPAPRNVRALKANIALNGLEERAKVVPAAVGRVPGQQVLMLNSLNSGGHSLRWEPDRGPLTTLSVAVITIDDVLRGLSVAPEEIGLLWMDVEGYEPEALAGAVSVLASRVPLFIEMNSHAYGEDGLAELLDRLAGAGYLTATRINGEDIRSFALPDIDREYLPGDFLLL